MNAELESKSLPLNQKNCAIFFNFTMLPPGVREEGYNSIILYTIAAVFKATTFILSVVVNAAG